MRLHRLIGIILLIEARGVVKARDLANALEASERTIYRDIDILCEAGLPVISIPGPAGGFSFVEGYRTNVNTMRQDDIINLLLSGMGIRPREHTENAAALRNAILKLEQNVPEQYQVDIRKAKERFYYDPSSWWKKIEADSGNYDEIKKAVMESRKLFFKYINNGGKTSERTVHPYGVILKDSEWYLAAFCESRKGIRTFRVGKISELVTLDEHFDMPQGFSLESYWDENTREFIAAASSRNPGVYRVKLKIDRKLELLRAFTVLEEYIEQGSQVYVLNMLSLRTAQNTLLGICDEVQILEPLELKDFIIQKAEGILQKNNR